jgi:Amt family ammonium transporter
MFSGLNFIGRLRVNPVADKIGIDKYEHGATVWPDVYDNDEFLQE